MNQRTQVLKDYETIWSKNNKNIQKIIRITTKIPAKDKKWYHYTSAYKWLRFSMITMSLTLLALSLVNLINWLN